MSELVPIETRRLILKPIEKGDTKILYKWRNNDRFTLLCSTRRNKVTFKEFTAELEKDFAKDRHLQYLIILKNTDKTIGTLYSYNFNPTDQHTFVTIFIEKEYERRGYGVEAIVNFLHLLFRHYKLYKVYMEVYDYNTLSLNTARKAGLSEEGRFKGHRKINNIRYDLIRFAVYREHLKNKIAERLISK